MSLVRLNAGEIYFTSFDIPPFAALGDDQIAGFDGWTGSSPHANLKLHGIMSESQHGVAGIGNAGYLGGNPKETASPSKLVWLRRVVNIDPLALNEEVATFRMVFGIKDSSSASLYRRDNFDYLIYNQSLQPVGGLRFDNTTLDTSGQPQRLIYRLAWDSVSGKSAYYPTGYRFLPEETEALEFRINFRTNRWTATLGGIPLFQDIAFHTGPYAKNIGYALIQMTVTNTYPFTTNIYPGDNYMLFDDYLVRTDPLTMSLSASKNGSGAAQLNWNEEAGYSYRLQYSADCATWLDFAGSIHTATVTANTTFTDPTSPVPAKRFYRVKRTYP